MSALFRPSGLLALRADAYGKEHEPGPRMPAQLLMQSASGPVFADAASSLATIEPPRGPCVAFVNIRGPLVQHSQYRPEAPQSYEEVLNWARYALCSPWTTHVVLLIASPGGVVAGCFDTARTLRALARQNGKRLLAFVEGQACSAGYAFASACDWIATADSSELGSIGVIAQLAEQTEADAKLGLKFELITSGARKADGNPHIVITDPARAATQTSVDSAAGLFYDFVATHRARLTRESVQELQAATFFGSRAAEIGLVDQVCDREQFIAEILSETTERRIMAMNVKEAVAALAATMTDDKADEKDKKQARKMLAALAAEDEAPPKKDDEEKEDDKSAECDTEEKKAAASAPAPVAAAAPVALAASSSHDPEARRLAKEARDIAAFTARQVLYAGRPDITPEQRTLLDSLPLKAAQQTLAVLPVNAPTLQAQGSAQPTQPAVQTSLAASQAAPSVLSDATTPQLSAETRARHVRMGIIEEDGHRGIKLEGGTLKISARAGKPQTPSA